MNMQRNTVQRQIILEALKRFHTHPAVDEIYAEIHKSHSNVGKILNVHVKYFAASFACEVVVLFGSPIIAFHIVR